MAAVQRRRRRHPLVLRRFGRRVLPSIARTIVGPALAGCGGFLGLNCRGLKTYAPRQERIVRGGGCGYSSQCSSPSGSALAAPIFLRLAPHRRRRRILDLEPVIDAAGAVGRTEALRDDPLAAEGAGVLMIELDGEDLRWQPVERRKTVLANLLRQLATGIALNQHFEADRAIVFRSKAQSTAAWSCCR